MSKFLTILFLIVLFSVLNHNQFAFADNHETELKYSYTQELKNNDLQGKEKFQFRIDNNYFRIKGVITSYSANLIVINDKNINIDQTMLGEKEIKIIGTPSQGQYAIIKGIIINNNYYAENIVINQRNKNLDDHENEDSNNDDHENRISITPTKAPDNSPIATNDARLNNQINITSDLGNLIEKLQSFLNILKDFAAKI